MNPLSIQNPNAIKAVDSTMQPPTRKPDRHPPPDRVTRVYPWLLFTSTAVAAAFCLLYIEKPVIIASSGLSSSFTNAPNSPKAKETTATAAEKPHAAPLLIPSQDRLPGENRAAPTARRENPPRPTTSAFEQTNLRIQHILNAESPDGHLAKIDLEIPVLYQSRNLRWTAEEVTEARKLLARLTDYQEKSTALRAESAELLSSWNRLVEHSIPVGDLRADSPTLPTNQQDATNASRPADLNTTELIQIQPSGK